MRLHGILYGRLTMRIFLFIVLGHIMNISIAFQARAIMARLRHRSGPYNCNSELPSDPDRDKPQTIENVEEFLELTRNSGGKGGVYEIDAAVFETWKKKRGKIDFDGDDENEGQNERTYEQQRMANDPELQADIDLEKMEEARAVIFQRLLGSTPYETPTSSQEEREEQKIPEPVPSEEQVKRKQRLMRELAEGMKINLAKEKKGL